jgi:hypothetical protein
MLDCDLAQGGDELIAGILFMVDENESLRIGERVKGGCWRCNGAGHMLGPTSAGYIRLSTLTTKEDRLVEGRYTRHRCQQPAC